MGQAASSLRKPVVRATSAASNTAATAATTLAASQAPRTTQPQHQQAAPAVEDGSANQQLLQNLTKLGQVTVDSPAVLQRSGCKSFPSQQAPLVGNPPTPTVSPSSWRSANTLER
ncbi:hypothetical protein FRC16_008706 [Serendipita sp. 398]|nr:hypothetical protein FRC16_008706 [Serendipita sp. 398]